MKNLEKLNHFEYIPMAYQAEHQIKIGKIKSTHWNLKTDEDETLPLEIGFQRNTAFPTVVKSFFIFYYEDLNFLHYKFQLINYGSFYSSNLNHL